MIQQFCFVSFGFLSSVFKQWVAYIPDFYFFRKYWVINDCIAYKGASYIRGLRVYNIILFDHFRKQVTL